MLYSLYGEPNLWTAARPGEYKLSDITRTYRQSEARSPWARKMAADINSVEELFTIVERLWPRAVDISGATEDAPIWKLVYLFESIENNAENLDDIIDASIWPFHQSLTKLARQRISSGATIVCPEEVDIKDFIKFLNQTLNNPSWTEVKRAYLHLNL